MTRRAILIDSPTDLDRSRQEDLFMLSIAFVLIALIAYLTAAATLGWPLWRGPEPVRRGLHVGGAVLLTGVALAAHGALLWQSIYLHEGINLGVFNALSLLGWMLVLLWLIGLSTEPLENLALFILPLAGLTAILGEVFPSDHLVPVEGQLGLGFHILVSVVAYGILTLAALHAVVVGIQDQRLRGHRAGRFLRTLPSLQAMENLLFEMIMAGFVLLTLSLLSGFLFLEDIFAQHLVHKTALSILAWFVFGSLLVGRMAAGWRGRTAIRWTLGGFASLMLAYFGSKIVLELILNRI